MHLMKRKTRFLNRIISAAMIVMLIAPTLHADEWITIGSGDIGSGSGSVALIGASPSAAYNGDTINVEITGQDTNFGPLTTVDFGDDITVNSVSVTDASHITANISISTSAGTGTRTITAVTGGEIASGAIFTVNAPSLSISPSTGEQGWTGNLTVTGTGSHFINGTTTAVFSGSGITVNSVAVSGPTSAVLNVTIADLAVISTRTLTVSTDLGALGMETINASFAVTIAGGAGLVIDDYEYYPGKDHRGMMNYYYRSGSNAEDVNIPEPVNSAAIIQEGSRSMQITYAGAAAGQWGGYWGGGLTIEAKDLTPYSGIDRKSVV